MSLRALPLIVLPFIVYNIIVWLGGGAAAHDIMARQVLSIPMVGRSVTISWGDLIVMFTLIVLFVEIVKATYTSAASLLDHALSMFVFIACLVQFLLFASASTGVFLNITLATLIDVIAGYTIGIRVARRDLSIGSGS